jgi:hypothetical protein
MPTLARVVTQAKRVARQYYALTGRPLGITGEIAELEAARLLRLKLTPPRTAGHDAIRPRDGARLQIKARVPRTARGYGFERMGRIDRTKKEWDAVLLVLLDRSFNVTEIHEASRRAVLAALRRPGSKARNVRGQMQIGLFKRIGTRVWPRA